MAAAVLSSRTADWIKPKIIVDSSGTSAFHIGQGAHPTSQKTWEKAGYIYSHSARGFKSSDFFAADLILVMDSSNFRDVIKLAPDEQSKNKVYYLRSFDPELSVIDPASSQFFKLEVPDPYNQSAEAYEETLFMIEHAVDGLLQELSHQ
jgi:protein-tyrosine phosphatase